MEIKKIEINDKELIKQIDDMYVEFIKSELIYDTNYNML